MIEFTMETALLLFAAAAFGLVIGWLFRGTSGDRRIEKLEDGWQIKLDERIRERDRLTVEITTLKTTIETQESQVHKHQIAVANSRTELQSEHEKSKSLQKDVFTLRAERESFKNKLTVFQDALTLVKQRSADLQKRVRKVA